MADLDDQWVRGSDVRVYRPPVLVYLSRRKPKSISIVGGPNTRRDPYWIALDRIDTDGKLVSWIHHLASTKRWWSNEHTEQLIAVARRAQGKHPWSGEP